MAVNESADGDHRLLAVDGNVSSYHLQSARGTRDVSIIMIILTLLVLLVGSHMPFPERGWMSVGAFLGVMIFITLLVTALFQIRHWKRVLG